MHRNGPDFVHSVRLCCFCPRLPCSKTEILFSREQKMGQNISGHRLRTRGSQESENRDSSDAIRRTETNEPASSDVSANKFANRELWPARLEEGKQGKHIPGHNNYQPGKSYLTISMEEAKALAERYSGTGQPVSQDESNRKERVDFNKKIGYTKDKNTGEEKETSWGIIHHSKKGTHIVPCTSYQEG